MNGGLPVSWAVALTAAYGALAVPAAMSTRPMSSSALLASIILAAALIALTIIDLKSFRLPDFLTLPLMLTGIGLAWALGWDSASWRLASAAIGLGAAYLTAQTYEALRGRSGLGLGDAKLFAAAGAWTGAEGLASVLLYACATALLAVLIAWIRQHNLSMAAAIPFGPFLAAGTWLVWLYGPLT